MIALLVEGVFHWGFSVRIITESAGAQYYLMPPPSTLIGALAYGVHVNRGVAECAMGERKRGERRIRSTAALLARAVKWASFAISEGVSRRRACVVGHSDFIRSFRLPYQRGVRHEQPEMWYGICASGRVYACGTGFKILYLVNEERLDELELEPRDILAAAHSIVRIGSREGLVSILGVQMTGKVEEVKAPLDTDYYFPRRLGEVRGSCEVISLPVLREAVWEFRPEEPVRIHDHEEYFAPLRLSPVKAPTRLRVVKLSEGAIALRARFSGEREEVVVVPREVVEGA